MGEKREKIRELQKIHTRQQQCELWLKTKLENPEEMLTGYILFYVSDKLANCFAKQDLKKKILIGFQMWDLSVSYTKLPETDQLTECNIKTRNFNCSLAKKLSKT